MSTIVCPHCSTKLELDDDMLGVDVQCGGCQEIFKAELDPEPGSRPEAERKLRKSKRRFDDDDDNDEDEEDDRPKRKRKTRQGYDVVDYGSRRSRRRIRDEGTQTLGIASLVLGIIGIPMCFCCGLFGIIFPVLAIIFGYFSIKTPGKAMGISGLILGVIGLVLAVIKIGRAHV